MEKNEEQVNRDFFDIIPLHKDDSSEFWRNKTYLERIAALEK